MREFLANLSIHDQIHTLIVRVEEITPPGVAFRRYRITDRVPVGIFILKVVYEADIYISTDGNIISEARQSPGIVSNYITQCLPSNGGTRVVETVTIISPRGLLNFVTRQAKKSRQQMF